MSMRATNADVLAVLTGDRELSELAASNIEAVGKTDHRPLSERPDGSLLEGLEQQGGPKRIERRPFIKSCAFVFAAFATANGFAESAPQKMKRLVTAAEEPDLSPAEQETFFVGRQFAREIAESAYSEKLESKLRGLASTEGEWAILKSFAHYRDRKLDDLTENLQDLKKAAKATRSNENAEGHAIVYSRLLTDSSFLGEGDACEKYIGQVNFTSIPPDSRALVRILDIGTTVALNTMRAGDFVAFKSPLLSDLRNRWRHAGKHNFEKPEDLFHKFGIESTGVLQQKWIYNMMQIGPDPSQGLKRRAERHRYYEELLDKTLRVLAMHPDDNRVAEDFLYSLHRLTFHAAADMDDEQMNHFLDVYFYRNGTEGHHPLIQDARAMIARTMRGSTPWMYMLDVARGDKRFRHETFAALKANSVKTNNHYSRAIVDIGVQLGHSRTQLMADLQAIQSAQEIAPMSIHQVYTAEVTKVKH